MNDRQTATIGTAARVRQLLDAEDTESIIGLIQEAGIPARIHEGAPSEVFDDPYIVLEYTLGQVLECCAQAFQAGDFGMMNRARNVASRFIDESFEKLGVDR